MTSTVTDPSMPAGDWIDVALRADGVVHKSDYVDDDGFTARVMSALPAPATLPAWRRPALAVLWGLAAVGIAFALPGAMMDVARVVLRVVGSLPISLPGLTAGVIALAAMSWAAAAFALRSD
ncbi:MAG: hypothetical protein ABI886_16715 [Betaproteobacteria bacterium]